MYLKLTKVLSSSLRCMLERVLFTVTYLMGKFNYSGSKRLSWYLFYSSLWPWTLVKAYRGKWLKSGDILQIPGAIKSSKIESFNKSFIRLNLLLFPVPHRPLWCLHDIKSQTTTENVEINQCKQNMYTPYINKGGGFPCHLTNIIYYSQLSVCSFTRITRR